MKKATIFLVLLGLTASYMFACAEPHDNLGYNLAFFQDYQQLVARAC